MKPPKLMKSIHGLKYEYELYEDDTVVFLGSGNVHLNTGHRGTSGYIVIDEFEDLPEAKEEYNLVELPNWTYGIIDKVSKREGLAAWLPSKEQTEGFWSGSLTVEIGSLTCTCDLYAQLLPYGCKCGGK